MHNFLVTEGGHLNRLIPVAARSTSQKDALIFNVFSGGSLIRLAWGSYKAFLGG